MRNMLSQSEGICNDKFTNEPLQLYKIAHAHFFAPLLSNALQKSQRGPLSFYLPQNATKPGIKNHNSSQKVNFHVLTLGKIKCGYKP